MQVPLGVQTWSLRNLLDKNPEAIFEQLATVGYTFIEPAGFNITENTIQGFKPLALKQLANDQGLQVISGHFQFDVAEAHAACELAVKMGMQYIIRSFFQNEISQSPDYYKQAADALNHMGEIAKMYSMQLAYHNHAHEFDTINGIVPFDILLGNSDPQYVVFQADLGWMVYAGRNPNDYFEKHPGRFPLWHLRDIDAETKKSTLIGEGVVPFQSIFAEKEKAGLQYGIVEMSSHIEKPLEKIIDSYPVLSKGF